MPYVEVSRESRALIQLLADDFAPKYVKEVLVPTLAKAARVPKDEESLRAALSDPFVSLRVVLTHYAFHRRGREREELEASAREALDAVVSQIGMPALLKSSNARSVWNEFVAACERHHIRPCEQLNIGIIAGLTELAQEIYASDGIGSIHGWLAESVRRTGRLEPQFLRMVDVRGVGPKLASLLIRDVVYLHDLEDELENSNRLFTQVIDRWVRLMVPYIFSDEDLGDAADWVLAGKICKYCRAAGTSPIEFNMGCTYFGSHHVRVPERMESKLQSLLVSA